MSVYTQAYSIIQKAIDYSLDIKAKGSLKEACQRYSEGAKDNWAQITSNIHQEISEAKQFRSDEVLTSIMGKHIASLEEVESYASSIASIPNKKFWSNATFAAGFASPLFGFAMTQAYRHSYGKDYTDLAYKIDDFLGVGLGSIMAGTVFFTASSVFSDLHGEAEKMASKDGKMEFQGINVYPSDIVSDRKWISLRRLADDNLLQISELRKTHNLDKIDFSAYPRLDSLQYVDPEIKEILEDNLLGRKVGLIRKSATDNTYLSLSKKLAVFALISALAAPTLYYSNLETAKSSSLFTGWRLFMRAVDVISIFAGAPPSGSEMPRDLASGADSDLFALQLTAGLGAATGFLGTAYYLSALGYKLLFGTPKDKKTVLEAKV